MPSVTFGSRGAANQARQGVGEFLAASDDRRSKTVELREATPSRIVSRLETEAFASQSGDRPSAPQAELSKGERESLARQHRTFDWQKHGFEAMFAKGALKQRGVDTWQDFYEPGEGVESAIAKLQRKKGQTAQRGERASLGIESMRTDIEEETGGRRQRQQAERAQAQQIDSAKEPAILGRDESAIEALQQETRFSDPWDISFAGSDDFGRPDPSGPDFELLQERNEQRSERAQAVDNVKAAPKTRDPIKWAQNPAQFDFPGIDTVDPSAVQESRSERARAIDASKSAPIADSPEEWADNPGEFDLVGVDTPDDDLPDFLD